MPVYPRSYRFIAFFAFFTAFFVLIFPGDLLHSAVMEVWQYPLPYLPEVSFYSRLLDRILLFGFVVGAVFSGNWCDKIGRFNVMFVNLIIAPVSATVSGYISDVLSFCAMRFLTGAAVAGILVAGTAYIFEVVPSRTRWKTFSIAIAGGMIGAIIPFMFEELGWRSMCQIQLFPVFLMPLLWYSSDEPLIWKIAVRDKIAAQSAGKKLKKPQIEINTATAAEQNPKHKGIYLRIIIALESLYFVPLAGLLRNRRRMLLTAIFLTMFGLIGLVISLMEAGEGMRQLAYRNDDLDRRLIERVQNDEINVDDIDTAVVSYIVTNPLILELISDESGIDMLPHVLRGYGYSHNDIPGCIVDGLFELVHKLRGERITNELVVQRAIARWNSRFGGGKETTDIPPETTKNITAEANLYLAVGKRTWLQIINEKQNNNTEQPTNNHNTNSPQTTPTEHAAKLGADVWQERQEEFLSLWQELLFASEQQYLYREYQADRLFCGFFVGVFCGAFGWFFGVKRFWTRRRIFSAVFTVLALLSMMGVLLLRQGGVPVWLPPLYSFLCGLFAVPLVTCYAVIVPAIFPVTHRGSAIGFCVAVPLFVALLMLCVIPADYVLYVVPLLFVSGVFATGIPSTRTDKQLPPPDEIET
ncbi:MAG: MFS transporter [Planctomycetaceae bacterium]|jgi:MFS family permease|nr:MFS transporter [Planctomycetaceae bacterium]